MIWTDTQIAVLTAEWLKGLTSAEIAASVGTSAEAIRAKRRQLGLPSRRGEVEREARAQAGRNRRSAKPAPPKMAADLRRMAPLPGSLPRPWLSREFGECAFPVEGEGHETRSCCLPVARGAYCFAHLRIMGAKS